MNMLNMMDILTNLGSDEKLSLNEREAINNAYKVIKRLKRLNDDAYDFQGWPINKLTMKDMREFVDNNKDVDDDTKILVLQDDGMGYGAVNGYCSDIYLMQNEDNNKEIEIWF